MPDLTVAGWSLLAVAAAIVGVSKTAMPGATTIAVAIFAAALPARSSTAALLVLLIVGDVLALLAYRRHADWPTLLRLAPAVVTGLLVGTVFLALADDAGVRRVIGVILLLLVALTLWQKRRGAAAIVPDRPRRAVTVSYGATAGFTTMVANAGGPAMSLYFLAARFPVKAFLGTAAWFFAVVNLAKLPFAIGLGLLTPGTLLMDLLLVPALLTGALVGRLVAERIPQRVFERIVLVLTVVGAVYLLL